MEKRESSNGSGSGDGQLRKGPWTMEEDLILINYIANHGEGVWNSLAKSADVRRGNITAEEQLIIMELHAKWGNRWSKIAKHLPGRTDNEIKNFWSTKIQKYIIKHGETPTIGSQNSEIINDQATNTSDVFNIEDPMEMYSPTTSCQHATNNNMDQHGKSILSPSDLILSIDQSGENYWSVNDLWHMYNLFSDN